MANFLPPFTSYGERQSEVSTEARICEFLSPMPMVSPSPPLMGLTSPLPEVYTSSGLRADNSPFADVEDRAVFC